LVRPQLHCSKSTSLYFMTKSSLLVLKIFGIDEWPENLTPDGLAAPKAAKLLTTKETNRLDVIHLRNLLQVPG